jgi:hypothetical protein
MTLYYLLILTFLALVAFAGYEETMRLVQFVDLQIRYAILRVQMKWLGWKLKRQLIKDTAYYQKSLKEYTNDK